MKYIYHLKPEPFEGTSLIPLNQMDKDSPLYASHAKKYIGREELMLEIIPQLNCKWNDVVQFSALDPQIIVNQLKGITDLKLFRSEYFKIHVDQIVPQYEAVIFQRDPNRPKGDFSIRQDEIKILDRHHYKEESEVPQKTIEYWKSVKENGGAYLWFPFVPHILVKGVIYTTQFEVCKLTL